MFADYLALLRNSATSTIAPLIALIVTLVLGFCLFRADARLKPPGIKLQQAWTSSAAAAIINRWKANGQADNAARQVLLDFLFIAAYAYLLFAFGSAAARDAGNRGLPWLAEIAGYGAVAGLVAGVLDIVENVGLLTMIWWTTAKPIPLLTSLASTGKFALIGPSYLVSIVALLWPAR